MFNFPLKLQQIEHSPNVSFEPRGVNLLEPAQFVISIGGPFLERSPFEAYDALYAEPLWPTDCCSDRRSGFVPEWRAAVTCRALCGRFSPLLDDDAGYVDASWLHDNAKACAGEEFAMQQHRLWLLPRGVLRHADGTDTRRFRLDPLSVWRDLLH